MQNENEKEVIEINLMGEINHFLIQDLERCVANIPVIGKTVEQYKFIESVLAKCKQPKPRFFSVREISTMAGFCEASFQRTKKSTWKYLQQTFDKAIVEWEKNHPDINYN